MLYLRMSIGINEILHYSSDLTMLYVEDDDNIREHTLEILEDFFQKVLVAKDGEEGLQKFLSYKQVFDLYPDIIITDIRMPKLDGIEMSKEILKRYEDQTIIVFSAHNDSDKLIELIDIGIFAFLLKPLQPTQIYKTLHRTSRKVYLKKIQERKKKKLLEHVEKLERSHKEKDQLLIDISYKLKTNVHLISGYNSSLLTDKIETKNREYLEYIQETTSKLLNTVDDILSFSQIEAGELKIEHIEFSLNTLLDYIFNTINKKAKIKHLKLLFDIDKSVPTIIKGDPLRLGQVITNIISNAVKHTSRGVITLKIFLLSNTHMNESLKFEIIDTGKGFTPDQLEKISLSLAHSNKSISEISRGSGLRLSITKQLITLMGGTLHFESVREIGSRFLFTVNVETLIDKAPNLSHKEITQKNILLIDSDTKILSMLGDMLKFFQFNIFYACQTDKGELLMRDNNFDVIFIEKNLIEQCDKEMVEKNPYTKIVMLEKETIIQKKRVYGGIYIDTSIQKPFNQQIISDTIYELFGSTNDAKLKKDNLLTLRGSRILLIDRDSVNQAIISGLLKNSGIDLIITNNSSEALEQLERYNDFELIFVDILDYEEIISYMQEDMKHSTIPIVLFYSQNDQINPTHRSVADGVLIKPINVSDFYTHLLKLIKPKVSSFELQKSKENEASSKSLRKIKELDIERGLTYTAGNNELYSNILRDFLDKYRGLVPLLRELVEQKQYSRVSQILHNLKKKSGHIGALRLLDIVISLEEALIQDISNVHTLLQRYETAFESLSLSINNYLKERRRLSNNEKILTDTRLFELLSEIYIQAKKRRALVCKELTMELESYQWPQEYQEQLDDISTALKKYKFKDAMSTIEEIV